MALVSKSYGRTDSKQSLDVDRGDDHDDHGAPDYHDDHGAPDDQ